MSKGCIIVAGGAGYIGSIFCAQARAAGWQPVILDRLESPSARVSAWRRQAARASPLEVADYGDSDTVDALLAIHKPVAAVCFAGLIEVGHSVAAPDAFWDNNFVKAMRFFSALERAGVRRLVFSSSAAVYAPADAPLTEESTLAPLSPYGMGKLGCEVALRGLQHYQDVSDRFIEEYARRCPQTRFTYHAFREPFFPCLKSVCLRYFNAAGADTANDLGEVHEPETHLVPNALMATSVRPLTLHGSDYATADGTCVRDYVHVLDLARAHLQALDYLLGGGESDVFNLGTGTGSSIRQILDSIAQVTGREVPVSIGPRRAGDSPVLVANAAKAQQKLGWQPVLGLPEIIASAAAFHSRHGNLHD